MSRGRKLLTWLAFVAVTAVGALVLRHGSGSYRYGSPGTTDWLEYWSAARLLWSGQDPYNPEAMLRVQRSIGSHHPGPIMMWNPPWLLLWLFPVLLPTFPLSALAWMILNFILLLVGSLLAWGSIPARARPSPGAAWLAAAMFPPALHALKQGQTSVILLIGTMGFLWCATRGYDFAAGILLALTSVKPHVVYLLGIVTLYWIIVRGRWLVVAGAAALIIGSAAITEALWPNALVAFGRSASHPPLYWQTPTVGGLIRTLIPGIDPRWQFVPPLMVGAGTMVYLIVRRPEIDWQRAGPPILLLSAPTAAYGWSFDQVILLPTWLNIVAGALDRKRSPIVRTKLLATSALISMAAVAESRLLGTEITSLWFALAIGIAYIAWGRHENGSLC